ncbi:hypothetical protein LUZ60_001724 [Juncus effusus]|nr:hypothetical protein LUZ60_001724 [Juncus effusus]
MTPFFSPHLLLFLIIPLCVSYTDPVDLSVLQEFYKGLDNPNKLNWPETDKWDPCGQKYDHVFCSEDGHVTQIEAQDVGLSGFLPKDLNKLTMLTQLGLQNNKFRGALPSLNGLANLQKAFLDGNLFDEIPSDFFDGVTNLQIISLDHNQLNRSTNGWILQSSLASSAQLTSLSLSNTSLAGQLPSFLGQLPSLSSLRLSYNNLTGSLPLSFSSSQISLLYLNNQLGSGLSGPIDIISNMSLLQDVWLHGNGFQGKIPESISRLFSLKTLLLNNNKLVGRVPGDLSLLTGLIKVKLENNYLMGPVPVLPDWVNFSYNNNLFCQSQPGQLCTSEVDYLLDFLDKVNYPLKIINSWNGNNPCDNWIGVSCAASNKITVINLPNFGLIGEISESLGKLGDLKEIILSGNNLTGNIPLTLTFLKNLKLLDVSRNNLSPPVPAFNAGMKLVTAGNPLLDGSDSSSSPDSSPSPNSTNNNNDKNNNNSSKKGSKKSHFLVIFLPILFAILLIFGAAIFLLFRYKKSHKNKNLFFPNSPPKTNKTNISSPNGKTVNNPNNSATATSAASNSTPTLTNSHSNLEGNFVIPLGVLRTATSDFSSDNIIGRGGFGVVYKGQLHDGTIIAVKRVESSRILSGTIPDEFQAEISTLSKIRHRNLVSIIGFSTESDERLLVYEYMPKGSLNTHLFHYKENNFEPLDWRRRLIIALDVARGMEYLHSLGGHVFIHRDLKSANILLDEGFRAKVADFGLVKLAPGGGVSVATRLAGTFGYLAPEYAVTGKITTKVDVFSFGIVLMELITGRPALDESLPDSTRHLPAFFLSRLKLSKPSLWSTVDQSMADSVHQDSIFKVAELAGHCVARDPHQRPEMGYVVNVLSGLVDRWRPVVGREEECEGVDFSKGLMELVEGWKEMDGGTGGERGLEDSKGSLPARPAGFADSFTSADAR